MQDIEQELITLRTELRRLHCDATAFSVTGWKGVAEGLKLEATEVAKRIRELTAQKDAVTAKQDASGPMTVRKLRRMLNDLPADLPIVLEGTEWDMEARGGRIHDWQETTEGGSPIGQSKSVFLITL